MLKHRLEGARDLQTLLADHGSAGEVSIVQLCVVLLLGRLIIIIYGCAGNRRFIGLLAVTVTHLFIHQRVIIA